MTYTDDEKRILRFEVWRWYINANYHYECYKSLQSDKQRPRTMELHYQLYVDNRKEYEKLATRYGFEIMAVNPRLQFFWQIDELKTT